MEYVIFFVGKDSNEFKSYQVIKNKTEQEINTIVSLYNSKEDRKETVCIVTDKHVVAAIVKKDSYDTIRSCSKNVKEIIDEMKSEVHEWLESVEASVDSMIEFIKDKQDAPQDTVEQNGHIAQQTK